MPEAAGFYLLGDVKVNGLDEEKLQITEELWREWREKLMRFEIHCHKQLYRTKKPVKSEGLAFKKRVIFLSELVKRVLSLLGLLC
nr:hypothetical protein CFP56_34490 [Quercus suber]